MKKLISVILVMVLSISSAYAVEVVNTPAPTTTVEVASEEATFLLASDGQVIGQIHGETLTVKALETNASAITGLVGNGKLVRAKARKLVRLDETLRIAEGGSKIQCTMEVLDEEAIGGLGITSVAELVDATIVASPNGENGDYVAFHRFLAKDAGTEVARIHFPNTSRYASVRLADWDGNGVEELCLRAGTASSNGNGGGNGGSQPTAAPTAQPTAAPTAQPTAAPTSQPTAAPTQQPAATPRPENDDVILPWATKTPDSTSSAAQVVPNPSNDDVTLPF